MKERLEWIDQARGLSIFLVVYGHNFPNCEPYIYSFHVPLFFFIAGIFHPKKVNFKGVLKRTKTVLLPYFLWASLLFLFWFFVGRKYGKSALEDLSIIDNLIGIFYAQGGQQYMDWGIPMWFLPCIFVMFLVFTATRRIKNKILSNLVLLLLITAGFGWARVSEIHLPWSIDVALVALSFYLAGNLLKNWLVTITRIKAAIAFTIFIGINILAFYLNSDKVDMYRSQYGNEVLFFVSGLAGSIAFVLFFKAIPIFKFLSYLGNHTIVILATHLRMLTAIKVILLFIFGISIFEFTEVEKVLLSVVQILMIIPIVWFINKYIPILDGKIKK